MSFPRNRRPDTTPQITVDAVVKPAANDTEVLVFTIPLGPIDVICIVNIPPDNETTAPVYVKFKFVGLRRDRNVFGLDEPDSAVG
jgi:hypothetical protein